MLQNDNGILTQHSHITPLSVTLFYKKPYIKKVKKLFVIYI
jgi:hypothetical protein